MKTPDFDRKQLLALIAAVQEGALDTGGRERLNAMLKASAAARRFYRKHMDLHARLHLAYTGGALLDGMPRARPHAVSTARKPFISFSRSQFAAAAALVVAVGGVLFAWLRHQAADNSVVTLADPPSGRSAAARFATVQRTKVARWKDCALPTVEGARLSKGTLRLADGLATLRFDSGAEVTLEAPCELTLVDAMHCVLSKGTAVATIPDSAKGFEIKTPSANVVDHGTRFAVGVRAETGETYTQVFEGLVEVAHAKSGEVVELKTGERNTVAGDSISQAGEGPSEAPWEQGVETIDRGPGWVLLETVKDAYFGRAEGHESDVLLYAKNGINRNSPHRKSYLGFSLAGMDRRKILEAELVLHLAPTGWGLASHVLDATFSVYGLTGRQTAWDEASVKKRPPASAPGSSGAELVKSQVRKLGSFSIEQGVQRGVFGIQTEQLTTFLRDHRGHDITLIVVRDTREIEDGGLVHGFASRRHPTLPAPTLAVRLETP
jgi:hypothetical protein